MKKKEVHNYTYAYEQIRDQILSGKIDPNTKLTEEKLAEHLGISRTPVRSAIAKLEQEGLIKNKRIFIPTQTDIRHIFQVRMLLEGFAARYCADYISEDGIARLKECVKIGHTGTTEDIMEANFLFHQIIVEETKNLEIVHIIDRMQSIIYLLRKTVVLQKRPHLIEEHAAILEAIVSHDGNLAEKLMIEHLQKDVEFSIHRLRM
ncbi:GntR family transcriptional regulator [Lysinibacillus yapensis]|uniref:GntR family transcriptional regulator n=1 Tax=Ureibacillus yapensis TaxID=2304605 RepID=A0A396S3M5_9BACL|nr:GntR family transcriptional regulator [Lysinibacillus yapensis]RHW33222.1 GntR family transcriptional regulator [Lysinibacillus yapensis]